MQPLLDTVHEPLVTLAQSYTSFYAALDRIMELEPGIHRIVSIDEALPGQYAPNIYLVIGNRGSVLVDTGWGREAPTQELMNYIQEVGNPQVTHIILTHRHDDHIGGASQLHKATGATIVAHSIEKKTIQNSLDATEIGMVVEDGDSVNLGDLTIRMVHTPGHTIGSLSVFIPERRALFTGDTVLGLGNTVIMPGHGDMRLYLESIHKMLSYEPTVIYPGHGPVVRNVSAKLNGIIRHRIEREDQLVSLIEERPRTVDDLLWSLYPELHKGLRHIARNQIRSHLRKLQVERRVHVTNDKRYAML